MITPAELREFIETDLSDEVLDEYISYSHKKIEGHSLTQAQEDTTIVSMVQLLINKPKNYMNSLIKLVMGTKASIIGG